MTVSPRCSATATSAETRSDAIIVSFDSVWYSRLRNRSFSAVMRKRIPTTLSPKWIYFHVNSPKGAICGRARLDATRTVNAGTVLELSTELGLTREAIAKYLGSADSVGLYRLRTVEFAKTEATTTELSRWMTYNPPQSFLVLSVAGKAIIDRLCGFTSKAAPKHSGVRHT